MDGFWLYVVMFLTRWGLPFISLWVTGQAWVLYCECKIRIKEQELLLALGKKPTHTFLAYLFLLFIVNDEGTLYGCSGVQPTSQMLSPWLCCDLSLSFLRVWLTGFWQGAGSPLLALASLSSPLPLPSFSFSIRISPALQEDCVIFTTRLPGALGAL